MKRVLAVLIGAGVAIGGGAAAWAGPGGGTNREAAKACAAQAKAANPQIARADLKTAVRSCLEAQGIAVRDRGTPTPEQQARRDALRACLKDVKAANPGADKAALREAAKPCLEKAGINPGQVHERMAAVKKCRDDVRAAHPGADRATLRKLVKECVRAK